MGKHKEEQGKSRVGVFLNGLGDVAKPLLAAASNLPGFEALNIISDLIVTDKSLNEEQKKQAISLIQLDRQDLINARNTNADIQASEFSSWMAKNVPFIIDIFIMGIWGVMTIFIIAKALNLTTVGENVDLSTVLAIYSGVIALATQIVSYHRGSSAGSKMKDFLKTK
jgi:hypothetical protein